GTVGDPRISSNVELANGTYQDEPFERVTARVSLAGSRIEVSGGQIAAGAKQIEISGTFDHAPNRFDEGRLRFQTATNVMPLEQIHWVRTNRPGSGGTVQVTANADVDLGHTRAGLAWRIADLHAEVAARGLQLDGTTLGDVHLTAQSQAAVLRAHLESDFA